MGGGRGRGDQLGCGGGGGDQKRGFPGFSQAGVTYGCYIYYQVGGRRETSVFVCGVRRSHVLYTSRL